MVKFLRLLSYLNHLNSRPYVEKVLNEKMIMTGSKNVDRCTTWEVEEIRQRGRRLKKTWWECVKNDMESLCLSQKDLQFRFRNK